MSTFQNQINEAATILGVRTTQVRKHRSVLYVLLSELSAMVHAQDALDLLMMTRYEYPVAGIVDDKFSVITDKNVDGTGPLKGKRQLIHPNYFPERSGHRWQMAGQTWVRAQYAVKVLAGAVADFLKEQAKADEALQQQVTNYRRQLASDGFIVAHDDSAVELAAMSIAVQNKIGAYHLVEDLKIFRTGKVLLSLEKPTAFWAGKHKDRRIHPKITSKIPVFGNPQISMIYVWTE